MRPKTIVTVILLLFVAVSVVYLVVGERREEPDKSTEQAETQPIDARQEEQPDPNGKAAERKVVAYYFHGNVRCATCRTIESYAKEAVDARFPDALRSGALEWRVINVDDPANEHYVEEFQLTTRSIVLESVVGGKRQDWKNLQRVWDLVRDDKEAFLGYVQDETRAFLEAEDR